MANRSKRYTFTLNNYTEEDVERLLRLTCRYIVVGREVGANGTPHLQGYVSYENARSFDAVRNTDLRGCHVEIAEGSPLECIKYCMKSNNYSDRGRITVPRYKVEPAAAVEAVLPVGNVSRNRIVDEWDVDGGEDTGEDMDSASAAWQQSSTSASMSRRSYTQTKYKQILEILQDNNYDAMAVFRFDKFMYANHFVQIDRICKAALAERNDQSPRAWKTKVYVFTGNPGSGKTYYAQRRMKGLNMSVYTKDVSEWWPNYRQQPIVFMDEYNDWFSWDQLLRLMSQLPETVPVKNSQAIFNARHLFITTHRDPKTWYSGVAGYDRQALLDRIDEWRVFRKTSDGQYVNELQKNFKDTSRRFLSMDEVEPITDEDVRREIEVRIPPNEPRRHLYAALMGVDEAQLTRAPIARVRAAPFSCLDQYDKKGKKRKA